MKIEKSFNAKKRLKVLFSNDFRKVLICQDTTIIEQRILIIILESIKEEQSLFINVRSPVRNEDFKQLSFDDYFDGWADQGVVTFTIPLAHLNSNKKMKNSAIQNALINMTNMNWLRLKDEKRNGFKAVPFILEPGWNAKSIYFNMDKAVLKNLLNMSHFYSIKSDLPFKTSSPNTLKFLMWIVQYKKLGVRRITFSDLLESLFISKDKYDGRSRFERDYLFNVKADLDAFNELSFNYIYNSGLYIFSIYLTKHSVGINEKFKILEDLKVERSIKYLKKKRNLNEAETRHLKRLCYREGHSEFSRKLNSKINADLKGLDYLKAVMDKLHKD